MKYTAGEPERMLSKHLNATARPPRPAVAICSHNLGRPSGLVSCGVILAPQICFAAVYQNAFRSTKNLIAPVIVSVALALFLSF
jgi:hypothetical protein